MAVKKKTSKEGTHVPQTRDASSVERLYLELRERAMNYDLMLNIDSDDWAAAGSVDTDLSFLSFLELYGTEIAERRMPARRVVEALDVVEHI